MVISVAYLVEIPVEGGGRLVVQATDGDRPGDLGLAAAHPGEIVAQASETLEAALQEIRPALTALRDTLASVAPQQVTVEFGIALGAETGIVVAKGTAEVHFTVTMTWQPTDG